MDLLRNLFEGMPEFWGGGVSHSLFILSLVISIGLILGQVKVRRVSLGMTWVLIVGLVFGYFNLNLDTHLLHFLRELGLVVFVYSIGLQVGPGFFSSFKKGGMSLNMLVLITTAISLVVTVAIYFASGVPISAMAGILSGAVTNTPGLGAAQQSLFTLGGTDAPEVATGYAVAYPMGVVGVILSFLLLKYILRIKPTREEVQAERGLGQLEQLTVRTVTIEVANQHIDGKSVRRVRDFARRRFVISRVVSPDSGAQNTQVNGETVLHMGDRVLVVAAPKDIDAIAALIGRQVEMDWSGYEREQASRRVLVTKSDVNGKTLEQLNLSGNFNVTVTRVNRSGVDLVAHPSLRLQLGDRLTLVGPELGIGHVSKLLGNSSRQLNVPNLIPIFIGIVLGCLVANIPFMIPGIPVPIRLGLAGGPFLVAILMGYFGPRYRIVTYTTISANMMLRELGMATFLACVGLATGHDFISTIATHDGLTWILYGLLITVVPILLGGIIGRYAFHLNYYTLMGVLSGGNTNPPALEYAGAATMSDTPAVAYATVYPFATFLRIISIQILILLLA